MKQLQPVQFFFKPHRGEEEQAPTVQFDYRPLVSSASEAQDGADSSGEDQGQPTPVEASTEPESGPDGLPTTGGRARKLGA